MRDRITSEQQLHTGEPNVAQQAIASSGEHVTYDDAPVILGAPLSEIQIEDRPHALRGAQILAKCLTLEGVEVLFGYPGGANLEIFDVLQEYGIRCIRVEHEQGAAHAAEGDARATGKVGVCLATSGPGATNLVTGIADANSDSVPIVAITGNVPSHLLGKNAFQEADIVGITTPITKQSFLVDCVANIPTLVRQSFALAAGNRPGPVLLDIPKDIQQHYPCDPEGNYAPPRMPAEIAPPEPSLGPISWAHLSFPAGAVLSAYPGCPPSDPVCGRRCHQFRHRSLAAAIGREVGLPGDYYNNGVGHLPSGSSACVACARDAWHEVCQRRY